MNDVIQNIVCGSANMCDSTRSVYPLLVDVLELLKKIPYIDTKKLKEERLLLIDRIEHFR